MQKKRVVLLNPPGDKNYLRGGYCSSVAKGRYFWPTIDHIILSGLLDDRFFDVHILDGIAEELLPSDILNYIQKHEIDSVICQVASASKDFDLKLLHDLKSVFPRTTVMANGEYGLNKPESVLSTYPFIDAVIQDYTSPDISAYLLGNVSSTFDSVSYRHDSQIVLSASKQNNHFTLPSIPKHHLFHSALYQVPWAKRSPVTVTLSSFGCSFKCDFCITRNLHYKMRPVDEVIHELHFIQNLGIKEVYFLDSLFNLDKQRTIELCHRMIQHDIRLTWSCMSRVNTFDQETLQAMRRAGCHTLQLGIENGNDEILKGIHKGFTVQEIKKAVALAHRNRFHIDAFFILGFPEETEDQMQNTVSLAKDLGVRFASFQLLMPITGTAFENKSLTEKNIAYDDTNNVIALNRHLTSAQLQKMQKTAFRKFYFRIGYIWKRLPVFLNPNLLLRVMRQAFDLLRGPAQKNRRISRHPAFADCARRYQKSSFSVHWRLRLSKFTWDSWLWSVLFFLPSHGKLYDLGCGLGFIDILYVLMHGNRVSVEGYDRDPRQVRIAKMAAGDLANLRFTEADILTVRPHDATSILLSDTLRFLPFESQKEWLKKIHENISSGVRLVVKEACRDSNASRHPWLFRNRNGQKPGERIYYREPHALEELLKETGFSGVMTIIKKSHYLIICEK